MGRFPVTNEQYAKFVKATNQEHQWIKGWEKKLDHPVVNISWHAAMAFCDWLNQTYGAGASRRLYLPPANRGRMGESRPGRIWLRVALGQRFRPRQMQLGRREKRRHNPGWRLFTAGRLALWLRGYGRQCVGMDTQSVYSHIPIRVDDGREDLNTRRPSRAAGRLVPLQSQVRPLCLPPQGRSARTGTTTSVFGLGLCPPSPSLDSDSLPSESLSSFNVFRPPPEGGRVLKIFSYRKGGLTWIYKNNWFPGTTCAWPTKTPPAAPTNVDFGFSISRLCWNVSSWRVPGSSPTCYIRPQPMTLPFHEPRPQPSLSPPIRSNVLRATKRIPAWRGQGNLPAPQIGYNHP